MSFDLDKFKALRPFLYHLTAAANIARIQQSRRLQSAASLLQEAGQMERNARRRVGLTPLRIDGSEVWLRDQDPLDERYIDFEAGWDMARLVELLNERVFFWPGSASGPIESGHRHFDHYASTGEEVLILRVPTASLLAANAQNEPQMCRYNSGAPGSRSGGRIPRGSTTFQPLEVCTIPRSDVKEVTFVGSVLLPADTEMREGQGSWDRL